MRNIENITNRIKSLITHPNELAFEIIKKDILTLQDHERDIVNRQLTPYNTAHDLFLDMIKK